MSSRLRRDRVSWLEIRSTSAAGEPKETTIGRRQDFRCETRCNAGGRHKNPPFDAQVAAVTAKQDTDPVRVRHHMSDKAEATVKGDR